MFVFCMPLDRHDQLRRITRHAFLIMFRSGEWPRDQSGREEDLHPGWSRTLGILQRTWYMLVLSMADEGCGTLLGGYVVHDFPMMPYVCVRGG